jgi:4-amino-4-deoxy-L-arabinose transferase-like glycosyltransferase
MQPAQPLRFNFTDMHSHIVLALMCAVFLLFKLPYVELPYYWDEAWVYAPAVQKMAASGLSLAPDAIPPELSRGHPLLFHFFAAAWVSVFGNSPAAAHSFALLVSMLLLLVVYRSAARIFSPAAGLAAVLLICVQPVFFAQSGLLLPEIMLALFLLLALQAYTENKWVVYLLAASAAILTKESAVALFAGLSAHRLLLWIKHRGKHKQHILTLAKINAPVLLWVVFLLWQYALRGWMFFPYHVYLIHFELSFILNQLNRYILYIFIYQGRNAVTVILAILLTVTAFGKIQLTAVQRHWLVCAGIFSLFFILMSAVNFYSGRYVITLIILLCMATAGVLSQLNWRNWISGFLAVAAAVPPVVNMLTYHGKEDNEPGYANAVNVMQQAAEWLTSKEQKDRNVYGTFLIHNMLTNERGGYLTKEQLHQHTATVPDSAYYIVWNNFENEQLINDLKSDTALFIEAKRFEVSTAQIIIYRRRDF